MAYVLTYAHSLFQHYDYIEDSQAGTWEEEIKRFYKTVNNLDKALSEGLPEGDHAAERLLQGPLSDAMTHIGQLSLLRRLADDPISGEDFFAADIQVDS